MPWAAAWIIPFAACAVAAILCLTSGMDRSCDPFAGLQDPKARRGVELWLPVVASGMPLGAEGQGELSRYRVVSTSEVLFAPKHPWVFHDRGLDWWPLQGTLSIRPRGRSGRRNLPWPRRLIGSSVARLLVLVRV